MYKELITTSEQEELKLAVRKWLANTGKKQSDIADACGMKLSTFRNYIGGKAMPKEKAELIRQVITSKEASKEQVEMPIPCMFTLQLKLDEKRLRILMDAAKRDRLTIEQYLNKVLFNAQ